MAKLYNLARMNTSTTGTGSPLTLTTAVSGFLTFALAGVQNGDVVSYSIRDGAESEIGTGTYTASGTTLTRTVLKSTNSDARINLSGTAQVFITPNTQDFPPLTILDDTGGLASGYNNNYAPTDYTDDTDVILVYGNADGTSAIGGLTGGVSGRTVTIVAATGAGVRLVNQWGGSTAANQFYLPNTDHITLGEWEAATLVYEGGVDRWICVNRNAERNSFWLSGRASVDVTENKNDWADASFSTKTVILLNPDAARDVTGISANTDGHVLCFVNVDTTYTVTFKNSSGSSSAGNKFEMASDLAITPGRSAIFWYDTANTCWRLLSTSVSGGGGDVATDAIWDAKGDLAAGTGADTAEKLTVGADGTMLVAASGETTGLKWGGLWFGQTPFYYPVSSGWTWDNQGSSTINSAFGYEHAILLRSGAVEMRGRYRTPANAHYRIEVCMVHSLGSICVSGGADNCAYLLGFRDSGGKIVALLAQLNGGGWQYQNAKWTTSTSYSAAYKTFGTAAGVADAVVQNPAWMRVDYDGTNIICYTSIDGNYWIQFDTQVATDWLAAGKPDVIWGGYTNGNDVNVSLLSWHEVALA